MRANTRHALPHLERFHFRFVQINHFAPLAKATFHQQPRQRFRGALGSREVDVPEIRSGIQNRDRVEVTVAVLVDFGHNSCPRDLPVITLTLPANRQLLTRKELVPQPENAAIAAHQHRFRLLFGFGAVAVGPGCLHGHTETDTVALPEAFGSHSLASFRGIADIFSVTRASFGLLWHAASFVVRTNNVSACPKGQSKWRFDAGFWGQKGGFVAKSRNGLDGAAINLLAVAADGMYRVEPPSASK